jgi:hypothetical protein
MTSGKHAQQSSLNSNFLWGLDMRRHSIVLLAGALGLLAVGCGASTEEGTTDTAASPSPSATATTTAQQPFGAPLVTEKAKDGKDAKTKDAKAGAAKKAAKVPGLLQSTDPDERAKRVQATIRGRAGVDPFASLPDDRDRLIFSSPVISASGGSGSGLSGSGGGGGGGIGPISGTGGGYGPGGRPPLSGIGDGGGGGGGGGGTIALGPANVPSIPPFPEATEVRPVVKRPPLIARGPVGTSNLGSGPNGGGGLTPLPAIPEPNLAKAVEVTGVITVGGITQAIVKAPNEPTSRHVIVGQRLSNGQVLVKRIESNSGSDPIVILEENGVEVARAVGDKPATATPGSPTAMLLTQRIFG